MKLTTVLLVLFAGIAAIAAGWIYQSKVVTGDAEDELEIPLNIDYYLSGVRYRSLTKAGRLDYELRSPYLEHYKLEDISRLNSPALNIYRNGDHWQARSRMAELQHQDEILKLIDDVVLQRTGDEPIKMTTNLLSFDANNDKVVSKNGVLIVSDNSRINADSAVFDLDQNIYSLSRASAVYYR